MSPVSSNNLLHGVQGVECSNHSVPTKFEMAGSAINRPFCISLPSKTPYIDRQLGASLSGQSSCAARKAGRSRRAIQISPCYLRTPDALVGPDHEARRGAVGDVLVVVEGWEGFVAEPFGDVAVFGMLVAV